MGDAVNVLRLTDEELLALTQLLGAAEMALAQKGRALDEVETKVMQRAMLATDAYYDRKGIHE